MLKMIKRKQNRLFFPIELLGGNPMGFPYSMALSQ